MLAPEDSATTRALPRGLASLTVEPTMPGKRPLRVLVVSARFLPDLGGIETHVYEVTRRLARSGEFALTVLATDRSGTRPSREDFDNFIVLRCRAYPRHKDYYIAPAVYRHILNENYDLIHCQGVHTAVPILAMLAAKRRRIPYVVTFHTGGHSSGLRRLLRGIQWRILGPLLRRAMTLIAVSRFEQRSFQNACHLSESRFKIIQNGGELPDGTIRSNVMAGRIVSSGRLERYKGHQRLIEALPIVQQSIPGASLQILGSGPYEPRLRALITRLGLEHSVMIEFIAPDDRELMAQTLSRAAVVATMSDYEAHPVAVMEALALGVPTIGLDIAGIGDLIHDGLVTGVPRDASPAVTARVLVELLQNTRDRGTPHLPTWDTAASDLAHIYIDAVKATSDSSARGMHDV
jgi:glycosyltransferase involved in cell wall biosynthesis